MGVIVLVMAGRPRSFDSDAVLRTVMLEFWKNGYDGVSIAELCAATGLTAPSLYAAFGDKDALFAKAVALYSEHLDESLDADLSAASVHDAMAKLLTTSAEHFTTPGAPPGCLIMGEPRLAERRRLTRERIAARLQQAVADGELSSVSEAAEISAFIDTVLAGMASLARDGAGREELLGAARRSSGAVSADAKRQK